jgi:uncharacterized protein (DUF1501 family)
MSDHHHHHDASGPGCDEYHRLSRRRFVSGAAAAAAAAAFPAWLPRVVLAESAQSARDVIVSVFLRGGADGLSMCVPFFEGNSYYGARPTIAIAAPDSTAAERLTALDDRFGFPPAMAALLPAYRSGQLLVTHATGVTVANRSHFDMQRFVEVGKANDPALLTGWLGRHLASVPPLRTAAPLRALGLSAGLPQTLYGAPRALPIADPTTFGVAGRAASRDERAAWLERDYTATVDPLRSAALDVSNTLRLLRTIDVAGYRPANAAAYPNSAFGRSLRSAAALIKADVGIEAVQVDVGGWDTHQNQAPNVATGSMYRTMADFAGAIGAFWADVLQGGTAHGVTLVAVSEFGRNVRENGNAGTDHGRAGAMFVLGQQVAGGRVLTVDWPGLAREQLESGQDLRVTLDHRDVLAEIVAKRLGNPNVAAVFPDYRPTYRGVVRA